jgi:biotin-(acetyl-CoA carboxylase) ligase
LGAIVSSPLLARDIYNQWRPLLVGLGQRVTIHTEIGANCPLTGVAIDVTENGELIVASDDGARHAFSAGDVSLRFATPPEIGD